MDGLTSVMVEERAVAGGRLIDLRQIFAVLRRRRVWVIATIVLVLLLTAIAYLLLPARYGASGVVALDRKVSELVSGQTGGGSDLQTDSPSVDTAVQVLTSPALAERVVDALRLSEADGYGQEAGEPRVSAAAARRRAVNAVRAGLSVQRTGTSYAISVNYQGPNAQLAPAIVNRVMDQYVADQLGGKETLRSDQVALLRNRLATLQAEVIAADSAVARYRGATNLIDITKDSTTAQQEMATLSTQLATAQADEAAARARLAAVAASGVDASTDAANGGTVASLRTQHAQLRAQRADLAQRYGRLHPDLARIDQQLAALTASIATEASRARSQFTANLREASGRTAALQAALGRAQAGLSAGNSASVQLNELQRRADSARSLYQAFLDRYRQTVAGQGTDRSDAYVISHAAAPASKVFPTPSLFAVAGLIAGMLAAALVVLVIELLENGFQSRKEIEGQLGLPVLANVPDLRSIPGGASMPRDNMGPANFLVENEGSILRESFRSICTALRLGHGDQTVRSVAICSALPGEGKTTTAICLARAAALTGARVVLVDCDVRRSVTTRSVASGAGPGLLEVLKGEVTIDSALLRDEASGMLVLGQRETKSGGYDLMISQAMEELIRTLSRDFDLVVLDTAPVLPLAEARAVASMADGALLVTRWRKTPVAAARLAVDLLARADTKVIGALLTMVDLKVQSRGGYGDELSYYGKFKEYYA